MPNKWWLISNETVIRVRAGLLKAIDMRDEQCARSGCMCDLQERRCSWFFSDCLHELESSMHVTSAVPDDWRAGAIAA